MKRIWFTTLLIGSLMVFTYQHSLAAEETTEPSDPDSIAQVEVEAETATFSNPAQAAHAANLSAEAAAALDGNVESAEENVATAETGLEEAQTELNTTRAEVVTTEKELEAAEANLETTISYRASVKSAYDALTPREQLAAEDRYTNAMNQAREDVVAAEIALEEAEANLAAATGDRKEARTDRDIAEAELAEAQAALDEAVSDLAGVSVEAISDMRDSKMGWGQIAHELGVHPAALGLGKTKGYTNRHRENKRHKENFQIDLAEDLPTPETEIAEATKRDMQHGWDKGHGMATSVASSGKKGLGLSETDLGVGSKGSKASQGNSGSKSTKSTKSTKSNNSSSKSSSAGSSSSSASSAGNSKSDRGSAGGPSNDKGNSGNSSSGSSKSDRSSTGGPSNDKSDNGNRGNDKSDKSNNGNKGGNSGNNGKSK